MAKIKRKGAYEYDLGWHQNHSALVVPKAAEAALVYGKDIREFITGHTDPMDFMLRAKVPRNSSLEWGGDKIQNTARYYISTQGDILEKIMPAKGPDGQYKKANGVDQSLYDQWHETNGNVWNESIHTKNKSTYEERRTGINTGWTVMVCNTIPDHIVKPAEEVDYIDQQGFFDDINLEWYIGEAEKLVKPLVNG